MQTYPFLILALLFSLITNGLKAQIVYLGSPEFKPDSAMAYSENSVNIRYNNNDGEDVLEMNVNSANHFRSQDHKKSMKLVGNFKWIRSTKTNLLNRWLLFSQLNYHIVPKFTLATILQTQSNRNLDVNERDLVAIGVEWRVSQDSTFKMSLTNYSMLEFEKADHMDYETFYRHSTRFSWRLSVLNDRLKVQHRIYVQPLYNNIEDFKILNQFRVDVPIAEHFSAFAFSEYYFDKITPKNRSQYYSEFNLGLTLTL